MISSIKSIFKCKLYICEENNFKNLGSPLQEFIRYLLSSESYSKTNSYVPRLDLLMCSCTFFGIVNPLHMFARSVHFRHTSLISIHYVHKNALAHLKKILACIVDKGFVLDIFSIETDSNDVLTWAISWAHILGSWYTQVWGSMSIDSKNNMMEDVRVVSLYTRGWYECSKWMKSQCEFFTAPNA